MHRKATRRAIVTAGGTREPIDAVRVVANVSTGRLGAALASALADRGVEVTLVASEELASHRSWLDPRVDVVPFCSFCDIVDRLERVIATGPPDLLLMAAAVADYSPVPVAGKIPSDSKEIVVRMRRNPKILDSLRARCGPGTVLVGFKLLSGASRTELVEAALEQIRRAALDLAVANDLSGVHGGDHQALVVAADGSTVAVSGSKAEAAAAIVEQALDALGRRLSAGKTGERRG